MKATDGLIVAMEPANYWAACDAIKEKRAAMPRIMPSSTDGTAQVNIHGLLMPVVPDNLKEYGADVSGYQDIADNMRAAADDPNVKQILMHVDSGGGFVKGVDVAASAIREAASVKPVIAYIDGMAASAAYWLTSQATKIQATPLSEVGGIGVYATLVDASGLMQKIGIRPVVVRSGPHKGVGEDAITDEQVAAQREIVDDIHAQFVNAVVAGRNIPDTMVTALATGKTWLAARARDVRLVDQIVNSPNIEGNLGETTMADAKPALKAEAEAPPVETPAPEPVVETPEPEKVEEEVTETPEPTADPVALDRERSTGLLKAFAHDVTFAQTAIEKGWTIDEAKAKHYDTLLARGGGHPVAFSAPKEESIPQVWHEAVAYIQKRDGVTASKAADWLVANTTIKP